MTDERSRPKVGTKNLMLGARVPTDIKPDGDDAVHPGTGGMSVTPEDPARLPPHLRPTSLKGGQSTLPVFWISDTKLGETLRFRPDARHPERHGYVEPAVVMKLTAYQDALAGTEEAWVRWP